jgi:cytochrome c
MMAHKALIGSFGLALVTTASAQAAGDPKKGELVFNQCKACHSLEAGKNGVGPTLHGLFGRKAGSIPDYDYSAAMKNSGVTWNEDTLKKYLADPHEFIPGTKMVAVGIKDEAQLDDLIAYLKEVLGTEHAAGRPHHQRLGPVLAEFLAEHVVGHRCCGRPTKARGPRQPRSPSADGGGRASVVLVNMVQ